MSNSFFPRSADALLDSLNSVQQIQNRRKSRDQLYSTVDRFNRLKVNNPVNFGQTLMRIKPPRNFKDSEFVASYKSGFAAQYDHQKSIENLKKVNNELLNNQLSVEIEKCTVYPPLLVRYEGVEQEPIPINILSSGELKVTKGPPDMIINFHWESGSITLVSCELDPDKVGDYEVAITTFYAMTSDEGLTVQRFTELYDVTRFNIIKHMKVKGVLK